MSKGVKILIAIVVVAVVAGGLLLILAPKTNNQSSNAPTNTETEGNAGEPGRQEASVTITYNGTSFSLSSATVKSGDIVKVVNDSSKNLEFESDPHPAHTNNPEFNAGNIGPGKSTLFTLTTKGRWGFHNHLNASQKGELTVE